MMQRPLALFARTQAGPTCLRGHDFRRRQSSLAHNLRIVGPGDTGMTLQIDPEIEKRRTMMLTLLLPLRMNNETWQKLTIVFPKPQIPPQPSSVLEASFFSGPSSCRHRLRLLAPSSHGPRTVVSLHQGSLSTPQAPRTYPIRVAARPSSLFAISPNSFFSPLLLPPQPPSKWLLNPPPDNVPLCIGCFFSSL